MKLKIKDASKVQGEVLMVKVTSTEVYPRFLYYWVLNLYNSGLIKTAVMESVIPYLTVESFGNLPFYDRRIKDIAIVGTNLQEYDFVVQRTGKYAGKPTWTETA